MTDIYILGISCFYHDSAACLLKNGRIIAAAQEERFTRKKHDHNFPENAIRYCLSQAGVTLLDVNFAAFYEKPFIKFERILQTYTAYAPFGLGSFLASMPIWLKQKLFMKKLMQDELGRKAKILFPEHHESHAASAFYPSPFREAAFLTLDGVGEWATASFGTGSGGDFEIWQELNFPHSLGLLYSAFTYFTGFKVNSAEYKVMGLAPYGEPKYVNVILNELIDLKDDGSFRLNMKYFNYCAGLTMTNRRFEKLFGGPPRKPESKITQREMDMARSIQEVTEEAMLRMARHVYRQTGMKKLCLAGGVSLNCVANGKLLKKGPFEDIWIQPAAGDAGAALGAALVIWHKYLKNERIADGKNDSQGGSFLGPAYSDEEIQKFLDDNNVIYKKLDKGSIAGEVSGLIAQEKVIGWFQGRMEFGPRALGSRSILADARSEKMQSVMNIKIKFRESFRPFAPSVLKEKVSEYFDFDKESPYMLLVAPVKSDKKTGSSDSGLLGFEKLKVARSVIPAVTHVDYSARIHTVDRTHNELFYELIDAFYKKTNCPVVINTSFNVRGEPIVCTPEEAYRCFMRTDIDYLVIGRYLLDKRDQPKRDDDKSWMKEFELD